MSESGKGGEPVQSPDVPTMIKALKETGMYDCGMPETEMAEIFNVIQLSKTTVNGGGGNNNDNKTPEQMRQDTQPSHSRGLSSNNFERESKSPELSENQMRKNSSQEKRGESGDESLYTSVTKNSLGKENKDSHPANMNKQRLLTNENFPEGTDNKQSNSRMKSFMRNHEKSKSTMNPLEIVINIKDVRLQRHYRTLPEKDCAESRKCVNIDEALPRLVEHLQKTAILWHTQQRTSLRSKILWGKPIQVDTNNANEDKEFLSDTTWPIAGPSGTNIHVNNDKRRRACTKKVINYTSDEISENNSDNDFEETSTTDKRKPIKRASSSEKTDLEKDVIENARKRRSAFKKDDVYVWNEEAISEKEEEEEDDEKTNVKRKKLMEEASSSKNTDLPEENENYQWQASIDQDDDHDDADDSDEEAKKAGKKKKSTKPRVPAKKITNTRTKRQKNVESSTTHEAEEENDDTVVCIEDSDEISSETLQKTQKNRNEDAVSSTSSSYPRRIVPPNPKNPGKYVGLRARKPLVNFPIRTQREKQAEQPEKVNEEDTLANRNNGNNSRLSQSEIADALNNDKERQVIPVSPDFEIKPLRVSDRMKLQQERLKNWRKQQEQMELQRVEEQRIKEEITQRQMEAKIRQRLKEENEKVRLNEQMAKAKARKEKEWNSILNQQGKNRQVERIELNPEGPRRNSDATAVQMEENHFETRQEENDVEVVNDDRCHGEQRVPCPICGKKFISKHIEDHAASCEEYDTTTTPDASRSSSPVISTQPANSMRRDIGKVFECQVCSSFMSYDGRKFEDHVNKCVAKHRDGVAVGPNAVIEVPDSPIRNLRKVSELIDSEINYKEQFVPKTKSQLKDNRKRKRI